MSGRVPTLEPVPFGAGKPVAPTNAYANRWGWWYSSIADYMLSHPGCSNADIAKSMGKHVNTISLIRNTDLFRDYFAKRKQQFQEDHDLTLREKMTRVAEKGLDVMLQVMEKKGDQIAFQTLAETTVSTLDRLGFSPKAPSPVSVTVQQNNVTQSVAVPISALEEARMALRVAESRQRVGNVTPPQIEGEANEVSQVKEAESGIDSALSRSEVTDG